MTSLKRLFVCLCILTSVQFIVEVFFTYYCMCICICHPFYSLFCAVFSFSFFFILFSLIFTHSLTHSLTQSVTHSLSQFLTRSLIHLLTHSLTLPPSLPPSLNLYCHRLDPKTCVAAHLTHSFQQSIAPAPDSVDSQREHAQSTFHGRKCVVLRLIRRN